MLRRRSGGCLLLMGWLSVALAPIVLAAGPEAIAARVDDRPISLRAVDAPSQLKLDRLFAELARVAESAVDELIDERLRALPDADAGPTPRPVTEEEVRAFRAAHRRDFDGSHGEPAFADTAIADQAIRHRLEEEARAAAQAEARLRRRRAHAVEKTLPAAAELVNPLAPDRPVARVDGRPVPASDLERAAALRLYRRRGEIHRERSRNLGAAIDAALLEREAARRGISEAALLAGAAGPVAVSDEEIEAFVASERDAGRAAPAPERARPYLEFQKSFARRAALLDELRRAARVEILLREPAIPVLAVDDAAAAPALGPAAGRRLVAFTNYRCRFCRATHAEIDRLRAADAEVRVVFRDFIPVYDPVALEAARLSRCAAQLGSFPALRAALLERDPPPFGGRWFSAEERAALARAAGVDPSALESCLAASATDAEIARDTKEARRLGFDEPPAFVVEGIPLSGMQSADGLARALASGATPSPSEGR